jgi:hypothetical protein
VYGRAHKQARTILFTPQDMDRHGHFRVGVKTRYRNVDGLPLAAGDLIAGYLYYL